jgi:hypothetical protein
VCVLTRYQPSALAPGTKWRARALQEGPPSPTEAAPPPWRFKDCTSDVCVWAQLHFSPAGTANYLKAMRSFAPRVPRSFSAFFFFRRERAPLWVVLLFFRRSGRITELSKWSYCLDVPSATRRTERLLSAKQNRPTSKTKVPTQRRGSAVPAQLASSGFRPNTQEPPATTHQVRAQAGCTRQQQVRLLKAIDAKAANLNNSAHHGGHKNIVAD